MDNERDRVSEFEELMHRARFVGIVALRRGDDLDALLQALDEVREFVNGEQRGAG